MGYTKKPSKENIFKKIDRETSRMVKHQALAWLERKKYENETGINADLFRRMETIVCELSKFTSPYARCLIGLKIEREAKAKFSTPLDRFNYALRAYVEELEKRASEVSRGNKP
jgi:hypothetical protein